MNPVTRAAHKHSSRHRAEVEASTVCGCFHCLATYPPGDIHEWIDNDDQGVGQTAMCPKCGIDSVLGDASGYPMTDEFLREMKQVWFGRAR